MLNFNNSDNQRQNLSYLIGVLYEMVRDLATLKIEDFKLMLAQKLTRLLGNVTFGAIALISAIAFIIFVGFAITELVADLLPLWASYFCVAGLVVLILVVIHIFRRKLIFDPLARFISKILLENN